MNKLILLFGTFALLIHGLAQAQLTPPPITGLEPPEEGGSETVANFLQKITPAVDTRLPESAHQAAQRIHRLIEQGHPDSALREIDRYKEAHPLHDKEQLDVQLLFLKARAYMAKKEYATALAIYQSMNDSYPELAEPWNNMALIYLQEGKIDHAKQALEQALDIDPKNHIANENIALIYKMLGQKRPTP